jgi:two-component system chemotaxis response regulator CheB
MGKIKEKTRVLIVDDSAFSRQTIKKMLEQADDVDVVGVAADGIDAMAKTLRYDPDVITLDFNMPEMDGLSFLRWVMKEHPTPVVMVSSHGDNALKALDLGAVDFITKPTKRASMELKNIKKDLLAKVSCIKELNLDKISKSVDRFETCKPSDKPAPTVKTDFSVVAIGASTGGPPALQTLLGEMPRDFPCGIIISQHMPRGFTRSLAERLNRHTLLNVKEAEQGDMVEPGRVLVCPGGMHMKFRKKDGCCAVSLVEGKESDKYVPSVDTMMLSASKHANHLVLGVVLTGMGNDGMKGMVEIRKKGGYTIAESEETAVVFGMPGEAIKAGAVKAVVPMNLIPKQIVKAVMGERRRR